MNGLSLSNSYGRVCWSVLMVNDWTVTICPIRPLRNETKCYKETNTVYIQWQKNPDSEDIYAAFTGHWIDPLFVALPSFDLFWFWQLQGMTTRFDRSLDRSACWCYFGSFARRDYYRYILVFTSTKTDIFNICYFANSFPNLKKTGRKLKSRKLH